MKRVITGVAYNFLCILFFTIIYLIYLFINNELTLDSTMKTQISPNFIDTIYLSTAIQSGVGFSFVYPLTSISKIVIMVQQYCMIASNLILLYIFTL